MDVTTSQLIKNLVGAAVRWVLVLVGAWLVNKGIITDAQNSTLVSDGIPVAIGIVMTVFALLWSLWQKRHANQKVDLALSLPSGTSRKVLEEKQAAGAVAPEKE